MMKFCIPLFVVFSVAKTQFALIGYTGDAQLPILRRRNYPVYYALSYRPKQTYFAYQPPIPYHSARYQPSYSYNCIRDEECPLGYGCYQNWFHGSRVCWPFHQGVFTAAAATSTSRVTARTSTTTEIASTARTTEQTNEPTTTLTTATSDNPSTISNTEEPAPARTSSRTTTELASTEYTESRTTEIESTTYTEGTLRTTERTNEPTTTLTTTTSDSTDGPAAS